MRTKMWLAGLAWSAAGLLGVLWGKEVPASTVSFTAGERAWWAVQPVEDPRVPDSGRGWARNGIDGFIAAKLAEQGLRPAPEAGPGELVRRIFFDLTGLPPTPSEVEAFVSAAEADYPVAVERLVDELLESPRYGERWAQFWLDAVRYAESDGYRADSFRPGAWRYRDYVIESVQADKPYGQFVREQLAGDELWPENPRAVIGTAFLRHGVYEYNQRNARMHWELILNEMTNVTGEVFLGLGVGCAQCHDHKFDPIRQRDYYAMQSFLATTYWPQDRVFATPAEVAVQEAKQKNWEEETAAIRAEMDALMKDSRERKRAFVIGQFPEEIQEMARKDPGERTAYEEQMVELVNRQIELEYGRLDPKRSLERKPEVWARYQEMQEQLKAFEHLKPQPLPNAFVAADVRPEPAVTYLAKRTGKVAVEPAFLTILGQERPRIAPKETSTGRRSALAEWIADPENPFSTRVIVNRIWQGHFGTGIVPTPNDLGHLGGGPSHPELLDWLTTRFLEEGWRFKPMHRLILTSATYRQSSRREPGKEELEKDPGNRLLWRFPPRRLSAEQVRDAMLLVSGELTHREGGISVPGDQPVRSVYVRKMRNTPDPMLHGFDAPQGFEPASERLQTTTPTQSLLLVNGAWPLKRAAAFAEQIREGEREPGEALVERAFQRAYGRSPEREERDLVLAFLRLPDPGPSAAADPFDRSLIDFCHALLSSNEFLYLH